MPRFSVYRNPDADGYLLDVQANILDHLNTLSLIHISEPTRPY